jgi:hypothetical protein
MANDLRGGGGFFHTLSFSIRRLRETLLFGGAAKQTDCITGSERSFEMSAMPSASWTTMGIDAEEKSLGVDELWQDKTKLRRNWPAYFGAVTQTLLSCHL